MRPLVQRLSYAAVDAVDPRGVARDNANIVGARVVDEDDARIVMSSNQRHAELIIRKSGANAFRACGLEAISAEAVEAVRRRCEDGGLAVTSITPSLPCIDRSVTFRTSEGHIVEVHTPMPYDRPLRYHGPGAHPKCLDHINFTAADPQIWAREMNLACGLLLTERTSGFEITWLRGADGRHHTLAAVKSHSAGVHHISWEFNSFQDFRSLGDNLIPEGRRLVWGPGRHGAGDNLFLYYVDPAGFLIECIAEMEVVLDSDMPTRVADPGENLSNWKLVNQWGALPPVEWITHHTPLAAGD